MPVGVELLRKKVQADKLLAAEVLEQVKQELGDFDVVLPVGVRMTGSGAAAARDFYNYKFEQHAALSAVNRELYHQRVNTTCAGETTVFLFTSYRIQTPVIGDGWTVLPWTRPLAAQLREKRPGDVVTVRGGRSDCVSHEVREAAEFGSLLPQVTKAEYHLAEGDRYLSDERELDCLPVAAVPSIEAVGATETVPRSQPEEEYRASGQFGLGEIIELADASQYQAMQLPFAEAVLIEGPPGSGKTSIGLMRIPCLLDQQWEELGRNQKTDQPYHTKATIRVLVMNEEMIEYLQRLIRNPKIGLDTVTVQTLGEFCRMVCRDISVLGGRNVEETPALTALKLHPRSVAAYAAGFQRWVQRHWTENGTGFIAEVRASYPELASRIERAIGDWTNRLTALGAPTVVWDGAPSLASSLQAVYADEVRRVAPPSAPRGGMTLQEQTRYETERRVYDSATQRLRHLFDNVAVFAKLFFSRPAIVGEMIETPAFDALLRGFTEERHLSRADLVNEWVAQTHGDVQRLSSGDFALTAWLAAHVASIPGSGPKPVFGGFAPRLTHVVIDEAQDVAVAHIGLLRHLLDKDGTMTLVGDLRQRVSHRGHFRHWSDFGLPKIVHAIFGVNYRQSQPTGEFVRALHQRLYGEYPLWKSSDRTLGVPPRVRRLRGSRALAATVAEEVKYWREQISDATVAVLYHGKWTGAKAFREGLETLLQDTLTEVHLAKGAGRNDALRRTNCAVVATVSGTKGLEFDAVIVIDPNDSWTSRPRKMPATRKNALYVACSRGKQGLSIVLQRKSRWHRTGSLRSLATIVE